MKRIDSLLIVMLLLLSFGGITASVSAVSADMKIVLPSEPLPLGQTTTVPVVVSHAADLIAFDMEIPNNLSGTTILINESLTPLEGTYTINSKPENPVQYLSWFTIEPVTQDNSVLFYLDIIPTSGAAAPLTLTIIPASFCNNDGVDLAETLTITPASLPLPGGSSDTAVGQNNGQTAGTSNEPTTTPVQTMTSDTIVSVPDSTRTPATAETVIPATPVSSASSVPAATTPAGTNATQAPMPVYGILSGLGLAVLIRRAF